METKLSFDSQDIGDKYNVWDRLVENLNWFKSVSLKYEDEEYIIIRTCGIGDSVIIFEESDKENASRFRLTPEIIFYIREFFMKETWEIDPRIFYYEIKTQFGNYVIKIIK
jgi:hypothetical protein